MKVAHVKSLYDRIGGIETLLESVLPELQARPGVDPLVILIADRRNREIEARLSDNGRIPLLILPWHGLKSAPFAARRLAAMLAEQGVDVIHTHDMRANLLAALTRPFRARPWICHIHGWLGPTHSGVHRVYEAIDRRLVRYADLVLVGSHATLDEVRAAGARRAEVIWNAVRLPDPEQTAGRAALSLPGDAVIFTILGRMHPGKGHDLFIQALAELADEPAWHGVIIGTGDDDYARALKRQVETAGLGERVTFTGFVAHTAPWIAASDVIVVPSRKESLPLTCLEGMAAARAVVVSRAGDLARVVTDGQSGLVVPIGDAGALAAALARLQGDRPLREALGAAALARIEQHHTAPVLAAGMAHAAARVFSQAPGRKPPKAVP